MDSLTLKFDSKEQIQNIAWFIESIMYANNDVSQTTLKALVNELLSMQRNNVLEMDLTKDRADYLDRMCIILSNVNAESINAACDISSRLTKTPDTEEEHPVLDEDLCFKYKGYDFELSACNNITNKAQILGLTDENIDERFPYGMFSDRYVCWMYGHKDIEGHTQEESDEPEHWSPEIYLVPGAWSWGAGFDLQSGAKVDKYVLEGIDKFLETFEE